MEIQTHYLNAYNINKVTIWTLRVTEAWIQV